MNAKALALGIATALSVAACATTTSPTGRTQYVGAVSQAQLDQLGLQAFAQAKASTPLSRDAAQNAYVGCVVRAVTAQLPAPWSGVRWEHALFDNSDANAWALPGGKIGVYTGIFKVATNQDQLAAVIAHEIGHVMARHHDERITRQVYAQTGLGWLAHWPDRATARRRSRPPASWGAPCCRVRSCCRIHASRNPKPTWWARSSWPRPGSTPRASSCCGATWPRPADRDRRSGCPPIPTRRPACANWKRAPRA